MTFLKYPHLEKYGKPEVEDITFGVCHIFPKLDGTNASVWLETNTGHGPIIVCGSRNRQLNWKLSTPFVSTDESDNQSDNAGFAAWMKQQEHIHKFLLDNKDLILYGEWLVPHTIKNYRDSAWKKFYVFDVYNREAERFVPYDDYRELLNQYKIEYIPCIKVIKNPSYDNLIAEVKNNTYLMQEGYNGEGIVIKNYEWKNKYNHITWAKIIDSEFKEEHAKVMGAPVLENRTNAEIIADKACTKALVEKEYAKIVLEEKSWSSKFIPRLLHTVFHCVVIEELWGCLKAINNGSVNFRELQQLCIRKTKEFKPELF